MKSKKDIVSSIRNGEKSLVIQPSPQAWKKLEHRLDAQRPKNGTIIAMRQWIAIAATLLVLVASISIWNAGQNFSDYDYMPIFVEELGDNIDCKPYCMVIEARKELPAFYSVPSKGENKDHS